MPPEIHSPARDPATASATRTRRRAARDTTQAARQDSSARVAATCHPLAVDRKMVPCRVSSGRALVPVSATVTSTGSAFIHHGPGELRACRARGFCTPASSSATPAAAPTRPAPAAGSESSDCSRGRMEVAQVHRATATAAASPRPDRDTVPLPAYRPARHVLRSRRPPRAFMTVDDEIPTHPVVDHEVFASVSHHTTHAALTNSTAISAARRGHPCESRRRASDSADRGSRPRPRS